MLQYNAESAGAGLSVIAIALLLFYKRRTVKALAKQLATEEELGKKLRKDNERLSTHIQELSRSKDELQKSLGERDDLLKSRGQIRRKIAELIDQTKLKDIMSTNVISIRTNDPFSEVARKMKEFHIRHLPVVDEEDYLVGLITQRMLYQIRSPRKLMDGEWYYDEEMLNDVILKHVMAREVVSLYPDQSMGKALMKMVYGKYGCIPIVDFNNKLVGIVTRKDLLKVAAKIYEKKYE